MIIYFVAGFDLKLVCGNEQIFMREHDIVTCSDFVSGNIQVFPQDSCCDLMPYDINLTNFDCPKNNFKIQFYEMGGNKILVYLKPFVYFSPLNLSSKNIKLGNDNYVINIYKQQNGLIQIFSPNGSYNYFADNILECEDFKKNIDGKEFLFVKITQNLGEYYFIFHKDKLIFQGDVKEININKEKLIILKNEINCYGQKTVFNYSAKEDKGEEYLVYFDKREICKRVGVEYLFMDAVKIKNCELAKICLSKDLQDLEADCLWQFFGEFDDYFFVEDSCVLIKNKSVLKIVTIKILNNLIVNISD